LRGVALKNGHTTVRPADLNELRRFRQFWMKPPTLSDA
jgi:hypothetical protein